VIQFDSMEAFDDHDDAIRQAERERIIKLLEVLWQKTQGTDLPAVAVLPQAIALIKDESKMITSELLPDGTIYIEEVKGEQKPIHTHDIEVFGAPCDCGTRHEYCGECDWVEPCEQEGEQK
jgi:hypothetical protein